MEKTWFRPSLAKIQWGTMANILASLQEAKIGGLPQFEASLWYKVKICLRKQKTTNQNISK